MSLQELNLMSCGDSDNDNSENADNDLDLDHDIDLDNDKEQQVPDSCVQAAQLENGITSPMREDEQFYCKDGRLLSKSTQETNDQPPSAVPVLVTCNGDKSHHHLLQDTDKLEAVDLDSDQRTSSSSDSSEDIASTSSMDTLDASDTQVNLSTFNNFLPKTSTQSPPPTSSHTSTSSDCSPASNNPRLDSSDIEAASGDSRVNGGGDPATASTTIAAGTTCGDDGSNGRSELSSADSNESSEKDVGEVNESLLNNLNTSSSGLY